MLKEDGCPFAKCIPRPPFLIGSLSTNNDGHGYENVT